MHCSTSPSHGYDADVLFRDMGQSEPQERKLHPLTSVPGAALLLFLTDQCPLHLLKGAKNCLLSGTCSFRVRIRVGTYAWWPLGLRYIQ